MPKHLRLAPVDATKASSRTGSSCTLQCQKRDSNIDSARMAPFLFTTPMLRALKARRFLRPIQSGNKGNSSLTRMLTDRIDGMDVDVVDVSLCMNMNEYG